MGEKDCLDELVELDCDHVVSFLWRPEGMGDEIMERHYDNDCDSILIRPSDRPITREGIIRIDLPSKIDRPDAVRVLRKCLAVIEGPDWYRVAGLGPKDLAVQVSPGRLYVVFDVKRRPCEFLFDPALDPQLQMVGVA